jgi:hypothetical protein
MSSEANLVLNFSEKTLWGPPHPLLFEGLLGIADVGLWGWMVPYWTCNVSYTDMYA